MVLCLWHDSEKAEEYYGRAILTSPGDGDVLSRYANLIWDVHKDAPRAESYYDQAIEAAPDDWLVSFLSLLIYPIISLHCWSALLS